MTTPEETDFKCKASVSKEDATGAIVESIKLVDLNTLFHPLEGSVKAQTTEFIVKVDGVDTDLNEIFEPVASGSKIPMDTKFNVNTTDLRDIFAGKDTIPAALKLQQLPRGDFTCDTYLKLYYDRSGSMEDSFPYIDKAVAALKSWFSKTFYGDTAAGRALAQQYVSVMNPASPWEQTMTWIAAAVDNRTAGREVSIAYINESDSGGTGHPGSSKEYAKRWKALTNAGGCKHAAIMGVWHPWFRYYPGQLKAQLNQVIFEGKALKDMNVSGFFDIQDHTPTSEHVEIIANWLNIPTKPEHLTIVVNAFESDEHEDKVQWTLSSEICGLTHVPGADPAAFTKTQKCWKIEVKDENDLIVDTVTDLYMRPETHTYETAQDPMTDFYCRLTAVGETDYDDKVGEWVLCKKIAVLPERRVGLDPSYISALKACDPTFDETGYIYDDTHYAVLIANWTFNGLIAQIELNILWVYEGAQSTGSFSPNQVSDIGGVNINNTIPTGSEALMSSEHTAGYCFTRFAFPRSPSPATELLQNFKAPLDSTSLYNATTKPGSLFHSYTNESISRPDACGAGFTNYEYNSPGSIMPVLQSGYGGLPDTYFLNAIGFRRNGVSQIDSLTPTHKSMINGINLTSGWTGGVGVGVFIYPVKKA